jgi:hypothetical protein
MMDRGHPSSQSHSVFVSARPRTVDLRLLSVLNCSPFSIRALEDVHRKPRMFWNWYRSVSYVSACRIGCICGPNRVLSDRGSCRLLVCGDLGVVVY